MISKKRQRSFRLAGAACAVLALCEVVAWSEQPASQVETIAAVALRELVTNMPAVAVDALVVESIEYMYFPAASTTSEWFDVMFSLGDNGTTSVTSRGSAEPPGSIVVKLPTYRPLQKGDVHRCGRFHGAFGEERQQESDWGDMAIPASRLLKLSGTTLRQPDEIKTLELVKREHLIATALLAITKDMPEVKTNELVLAEVEYECYPTRSGSPMYEGFVVGFWVRGGFKESVLGSRIRLEGKGVSVSVLTNNPHGSAYTRVTSMCERSFNIDGRGDLSDYAVSCHIPTVRSRTPPGEE